jgi:tetratricopeptide (TPR) repeat protein
MGEHQAATKDVQFIWEKRDDEKYKRYKTDIAWAAFEQGMFSETIERVKPFFASEEERFNALLLSGLSSLALGNFESAEEHLSQTLEMSNNPIRVTNLIIELEQLQQRSLREGWPLSASITAYLNRSRSILNLAKSKRNTVKTYQADPIKELENVLSGLTTGQPCQPGSWRWLAAQAGLGRLYLETDHRKAALQAYEALSLYPKQVPEAPIGIKKAKKKK